ncbi:MAG: glucose-1-phosphate cytidylyltransferase [Candidatus Binataceae bacterium]
MKVVILAGGLGTRLREETEYRPKPMVLIGGRPILWHIMKIYAGYGHTDFVVCLGYRGDVIRDYFLNYEIHNCDFTVTLGSRELDIHNGHSEHGWRLTLAETGEKTMTGGRIKRVAKYLRQGTFMASYGDGVADIAIDRLLELHRRRGKLATLTAVRPLSRFGELSIDGERVRAFHEKPQITEGWINGGYFVFEPEALDLIAGDEEGLEAGLLSRLAVENQLAVYQHDGFWQCMDTYRELKLLDDLWSANQAPWKTWQ